MIFARKSTSKSTDQARKSQKGCHFYPPFFQRIASTSGDVANRRFFYKDNLTGKDGLFREVVRALYDNPPLVSGPNMKTPWLEKLKADGVFLVDLATVPVNEFGTADREAALARNISQTVSLAGGLSPD